MRKFVRRFSSASLDLPPPGKREMREKSSLQLVTSTAESTSCSLEYLGYTYVKDARSLREIQTAISTVKQTSLNRDLWVSFTVKAGMLSVYETTGETLITSSVACIAQCVCELNRSRNDCLAISFSSGHNSKQCHVFQAKSARQASEVVHVVQKVSRSAQKPRARGQSDVTSTFNTPQPLDSPKLGVHLMEDEEGEVIEHKPISRGLSRNESKRMVIRPPSADYNATSYLDSFPLYGNNSLGFMTTPPKGRRKGTGMKRLRDERAFSRQDKVAQILSASDKIAENNTQLATIASKRTPSSPFEDALYAMYVSNSDLLCNYIKSGHIHGDACDSTGNSLLHYAVAMGDVEAVKVICKYLNPVMINSQGWNKCTATFRAVVKGNISILRVLLSQNANVNTADLMRRTPLHFTAARKEHMECSIALLEAGAQLMTADILGLRSYDLDPELKETQSRLVISACELFSSSAPSSHTSKRHAPSATPTTTSPLSTRPSSFTSDLASAAIRSHYQSHDYLRPHPHHITPATVAVANARVTHWMLRSRRRRRLASRSLSNLYDLQEEEEDEALIRTRLERLKFPSDSNLNSTYYELEETADDVMRNINKLIKIGERAGSARGTPEERSEGNMRMLRRQQSLSEPTLAVEDEVAMDTPPLMAHVSQPQSPLLGSEVMDMRPESVASHSSSGTVVRQGEGGAMRDVNEAFSLLEEDLWRRERGGGGGEGEGEVRRRELVRMSLPVTLMERRGEGERGGDYLSFSSRRRDTASPLSVVRTASDTEAIFDDILSQIHNASRDLDSSRIESPDYDRLSPRLPHKPHSEGVHDYSPTSGAALRKISGVSKDDIDGPRALVRRLSRRRDPPFLEEMLHGHHSTLSGELLARRVPHRTKFRLLNIRSSSPVPNIITLPNSDSIPPSATSHVNFDLLHHLVIMPDKPRLSVASDDVTEVAVGDLGPATRALKLMVCLSSNKECLATLVSYLCLPKFMNKIAVLAKSPATPPKALGYIATLITNVFETGGVEGRRAALGSGFMDLVIKLLHTRDPIPGTCLSLLNGLLVSEEDNDHLQRIVRVPSEPLLMYLEPCEMSGSDTDSGIGSRHLSRTTPSGSDNQMNVSDSSRPNSGVGANILELPPPPRGSPSPMGAKPRTDNSDTISVRSIASPTLKGLPISQLEAKAIVLKMLSVSSAHHKMQKSLTKPHSIALLCGCLGDVNQDNMTNAAITLANVAQNVDSHDMLREAGVVAKLRDLLGNGPRQRFHGARGLVYMGELDLAPSNVFTDGECCEVDSVVLSTDEDDGHSYARGATVEKCVEFLTESISHLWGGFSLKSGPRSPGNELMKRATKQQIMTFFLTSYQSFMHPLIFIRLLLHRLATPCSQNPFDWSVNSDKCSVPSFPHVDTMPPHQTATLNVIGRWLEDHPDDFITYPQLNDAISQIIVRLKLARGPYTTHCHRLRSLQQDVNRPRTNTLRFRHSVDRVSPQHNRLYATLKNVLVVGQLPVTLDEAVYLTALQLHIEMVAEPSPFIGRGTRVRGNSSGIHQHPSKSKKSFTGRLKSTLPSGYTRSKPLLKRVRTTMSDLDSLSERNAKHLFIEHCQALPGYECSLYPVRVPQGARFRKEARQILGVNVKRVVFLDDKTKELVSSCALDQIVSVSIEEDPCLLVLTLREGGPVRFHVETSRVACDIRNLIQRGKDGGDIQPPDEGIRWSPPSPSPSSSSLSSDENTSSRETTPSPSDKPSSNGTKPGPHGTTSEPTSPNPPPSGATVAHLSLLNGHMRTDSIDDQVPCQEAVSVPYCDCPPDPEIPRHISLYQLSVSDVLKCPLECARQMTLIAHEHYGRVSAIELLQKVHLIPKNKSSQQATPTPRQTTPPSSETTPPRTRASTHLHVEIDTRPQTAVERLAYRFNQVGNWVAATILTFDDHEQRVDALEQFILIAKHCLDLRNYSTMMAIVMAGLGSAPIRRLHRTWDAVSKIHMEMFRQMDTILESKSNYKNYRDKLSITPVPAVPYIGVFLKDLTFIADGNPDYIRGGLVNLHKRRQVYQKLEEIDHFQQGHYNYHTVPELQAYLLGFHPILDEELHSKSHTLEPRIRRSHSHSSTRAKSSTASSSTSASNFFKALTRSSSSSSTNLHRTS